MIAFLLILPFVVFYALFAIYAERKVAAFIQDRLGPMEVGPYGIFQTVADILKLLQKEDLVPQAADRWLFLAAPVLVFTVVFGGFAVVPLSPDIQGVGTETGIFFTLAIISLDTIGLLLAGWSSGSKYSFLGGMRSVAQMVSYEIPVGLAVLCVVVLCQSLDLQAICYQQGIFSSEKNYLFGLSRLHIDFSETGGFLTWNVVRMPFLGIVALIFFIATLAECNRSPFDLPEAESELVGGFHTEYSGFRWAVLFLAEYAKMLLVCLLGAILFWGGWNTPFPNLGNLKLADWTSGQPGTLAANLWGVFWLFSKAFLGIFLQIWIRWTYPRLRIDQLTHLCWKVLTPAALILLLLTAVWRLWM
jgi:NADH-quinone oxidoreductase subunit H